MMSYLKIAIKGYKGLGNSNSELLNHVENRSEKQCNRMAVNVLKITFMEVLKGNRH